MRASHVAAPISLEQRAFFRIAVSAFGEDVACGDAL
jgi:hypothetical protein